jgi:hypothetical protein
MCRSQRWLLPLLLLPFLAAGAIQPRAASDAVSEDEVLRQIKSDVFDEKWDSVLADCDRLIAGYPDSSALARTMYYRAKALQHMSGKEDEALAAYGAFIEKFPNDSTLREDANISRMNLAKSLWLNGKKDTINILTKGLEEKGYPKIYAAVQISHLDNKPARARALPVLLDCSQSQKDAEVRNECTLAILRIDPSALPQAPASSLTPPPSTGKPAAAEPKLIRLEVRNKKDGKVTVSVNLPIAFAEALLGSLSEFDRGQVAEELKKRQIDINNIWRSLKTLGPQTLVQIETDEGNIRIWLE